jgi:HAD superfamily hydrolase (TIGR01459 family)
MPISTLPTLLSRYDAFIIDLWGVVHDGTALYPGAASALAYLHTQKKPVVFLSNAPRQAQKAIATLDRLGIPRDHYRALITSGQIAHDLLAARSLGGEKRVRHYYYLGPSKDEDILTDLENYVEVSTPENADFILNTGYEVDFQPHNEILPTLQKLHAAQLPLLCVNPDLEVVKQDGTEMLCAGSLAAEYERIGGTVEYIGKPHANAFAAALAALPEATPKARVLMIGDNPATDILGAKNAGIDRLLITGGILKVRHGKILSETEAKKICPDATYVLPAFAV